MLLPSTLHSWDKIWIVAPSMPPNWTKLKEPFDKGIAWLENHWFVVKIGKHVFSETFWYMADPKQKADDINTMFADPSIKMVMSAIWGNTANTVLKYIDYKIIRSNPKIFMGISDITVLLNAIQTKTNMITFHGNDLLMWWWWEIDTYIKQQFTKTLIKGELGIMEKNSTRKTIQWGKGQWDLVGWNIKCLLKLAGTEYRPDMKNKILVIEDYASKPEELARMVNQLKQLNVFDQISWILIGYIYGLQTQKSPWQLEDIILQYLWKNYTSLPIVKCDDFGHNCSNTILPIWAGVLLDADNATLQFTKAYIS